MFRGKRRLILGILFIGLLISIASFPNQSAQHKQITKLQKIACKNLPDLHAKSETKNTIASFGKSSLNAFLEIERLESSEPLMSKMFREVVVAENPDKTAQGQIIAIVSYCKDVERRSS